MIPQNIVDLMSRQSGGVDRALGDLPKVDAQLKRLGLSGDEEISMFFRRFSLAGVLSSKSFELLDICTPAAQIFEATAFAEDSFAVEAGFIALTSGEGEGFVLLRKADGAVFDVGVNELDDLEAGTVEPRWPSFFALLEWYLLP